VDRPRLNSNPSAPRDEDQLTVTRAHGFTAPSTVDALDREAGIGDGLAKSLLAPEPQAGVAPKLFTLWEAVVVREADAVIAEAGNFGPDQDGRAVAKGDLPARVLWVPPLPDACLWVIGVERENAISNQRSPESAQRAKPLVLAENELRHMACHDGNIKSALGRRLRRAVNPRHPFGSGLGARRGEGRRRWIDAGDVVPTRCQSKSKPAGAAAQVEDPRSRRLVSQSGEIVIVPRPRALGVVHLDEARVIELGVVHVCTLQNRTGLTRHTTPTAAIREATSSIVPDPTTWFANTARLIHPQGVVSVADEHLVRLAATFQDTVRC
jgi:hypothetical protein